MHIYSSMLDPSERPRPRRVYDNPRVVQQRPLFSRLFERLKSGPVTEPAGTPSRRPELAPQEAPRPSACRPLV